MRVGVVVASLVAACGGDSARPDALPFDAPIDADEGVGERVLVKVIGVRDPMTIALVSPERRQVLNVTEDVAAAPLLRFPLRLVPGTSFTVELAGGQTCEADAANPSVVGDDEVVLSFVCDGVVDLQLFSQDVPLHLVPKFDPRVLDYVGVQALLLETTDAAPITAMTAYPDATVAITPSPTTVADVNPSVQVMYPGMASRTYTFAMQRDAMQDAWVKAGTTVADARFGGIVQDGTLIGGKAVAVSGDTLAVGAPGRPGALAAGTGAVSIFVRSGSSFAPQATLTAAAADTRFGVAVALDGNTLVIGAPFDGVAGAAFVYRRNGTDWGMPIVLRPSTTNAIRFGSAVAISGTYLVVGAPADAALAGAAYVYRDINATNNWTLDTTLTGPVGSRYGGAVAITSAIPAIAVGSPSESAAYVYAGAAWTAVPKISGPAGSRFGTTLGLDGDQLAVGAPAEGVGGTVHVFLRSGATWPERTTLVASDGATSDAFGTAVGVDANHIVVGANAEEPAGLFSTGAVYAYRCTGNFSCAQIKKVAASNLDGFDELGTSVAVDGLTFATGAPGEDSNGASQGDNSRTDSGAAYVFR
jgi:hypothetical protein